MGDWADKFFTEQFGPEAHVVTGHGLSTNIIEASLEAYILAANKLRAAELDGTVIPMRRSVEQLP